MIDFLHYIHHIYLTLTLLIQNSKEQKAWKNLFLKKLQGGNSMIWKK